ncbi:aminotransferase class V-fold PLP-dependent enzyme [Ktedonosporobacter rubrisoli]|uniref:Aminotransferase class V-fold PLP-dependent enzyme n=1 Tax=Ktedonosporobacter rubrisoli TaxID=2509675 RepID=A0A4P6K4Y1_KTERU|nr:aminotransferase class V-fold PLP-dependent enzyme [Ktedonosporobacter rubrisoli]QBD82586.1 aminotransferase class V-fold PLP-dependent enzyme [Ktedonosporobacter rubrisoli]
MLTISRLAPLSLAEARQLQFRLVEAITQEFAGHEWLSRGDLGVGLDGKGSRYTRQAERALARMFGVEDAVFVTGAGTGAIRCALFALLPPLSRILVHEAQLYPTTAVTFRAAGYQAVPINFDDEAQLTQALAGEELQAVLIQHTRQNLATHYQLADVISIIRKRRPELVILVDDNYAVANTPKIGVELGAAVSAFSSFKLLGPEGIGIVLCTQAIAERIRADMYSGGSRVQGFQAQEALIGLSMAFMANATTQETVDTIVTHIRKRAHPAIAEAHIANMQSPIILIRFHAPIGSQITTLAARYGAAPFPVGAMSRYELIPMFYRVSGTMTAELGAAAAQHWIRINPMRAGAETVLRILEKALNEV